MSKIDDEIKKALENDEEALEELEDEPSVFEMVIQCYRGKNRWLNIMAMIDVFFFLGIAIWALIEFFDAQTTKALVGWAMLFMSSLIVIGLIKIWIWMQIHSNQYHRELKRLELQIIRLKEPSGSA